MTASPIKAVILVVEDNPITRKSVRVALQVEGYRVLEAGDGAATLAHMERATPDLILLDLLLPDIHGVDLMHKIRALPGGAEIPILAFSGFVSKMEEARVAGAGFTDFLLKPVEPSRLIKTVQSFLAPAEGPSPVGHGQRLLLVDDDPVQLKLLRLQFEHVGFAVSYARDGKEALAEARRAPPELIMSDVLMPHLDGFELCLAVRQDKRLKGVPVVLVSANYLEDADRALGERVGASAFVFRNAGFEALRDAVLSSLTQPVPTTTASANDIEVERHQRIVHQLERQVALHAACVQRIVIQSAILHELGIIADTLAKRKDLEAALNEILAYCLDGAGLSKGALYLIGVGNRLALSAHYGCHGLEDAAAKFFGAPELFRQVLALGETVLLPSAEVPEAQSAGVLKQTGTRSALLVPVRAGDNDVAVLLLLSLHRDLLEQDWIAFGRALAAQIGQSVALSRVFYRLAESEEKFRQLAEGIGEVFYLINPAGTEMLYVSPAYEEIWGRSRESLYANPRSWMDAVHPDDRPTVLETFIASQTTGEGDFQYRIVRPDRSIRFIHARSFAVRDAAGKLCRIAGLAEDVTERRQAAQALRESERRFKDMLDNVHLASLMLDRNARITYCNDYLLRLTGWRREEVVGQDWFELFVPPEEHDFKKVFQALLANIPGARHHEIQILTRAGGRRLIRWNNSVLCAASGEVIGTASIGEDVTEAKQAEETIQRLAYIDTLTGLPNRAALQERLHGALGEAQAKVQPLALLLINLNNFREINDTLGHPNGDRVLMQVAERLKTMLWESDMVARLGADEFAVLLPRLADPRDIELVARKIADGFKTPFTVAEVPLDVQVSIGIALYPHHGKEADALFQHADVALYAAKAQHHTYVIYDAGFDQYDPQKLALMAELRAAIGADQLLLHYQPKIDLKTGRLAGVEALVRWSHPKRGLMPPKEFIPLAEKTGLIDELTSCVVRRALQQLSDWRAAGVTPEIAVNISARNLQDQEFVRQIMGMCAQDPAAVGQLIFEITESAIMVDPAGAKRKLEELRAFGVRFSIDDFGTGYSSLAYLKELPVSQLKIDQSFIMQISEPGSAAIVRSTIDLAHNLGLSVVAEGVEDQATADRLRNMGCDIGQGYYFARPLPLEELPSWLHNSTAAAKRSAS